MAEFIDEVKVFARAGAGGNGIVAWRREAMVSMGGPAGGDGGNGGDVVFVADDSKTSLISLKYGPHVRAENGENGRSKNQFGANGKDVVVHVPVGTQVFDFDTGEELCDLTEVGQRAVVCKGGSGGFGNTRFKSSTNQAPDFAKKGLDGDEKTLRVSLRLMADVGLLGFPNAGKSTFLRTVSAAKPAVADYPFTTLTPKLGVVETDDYKTFVIADVPGLIEGASDGAGLGIRFLKHLERVRVLCHLIEAPAEWQQAEEPDGSGESNGESDAATDDDTSADVGEVEAAETVAVEPPQVDHLVKRYQALRQELEKFSAQLAMRPEICVLSKIDLLPENPMDAPEVLALKRHLDTERTPLFFMSAVTGKGVEDLKRGLLEKVEEKDPARVEVAPYDPLAKDRREAKKR